jgi:hypothetical protein
LTLAEAAILLEREDVYWDTEWLPLAEAVGAVAAALLLAARFLHRGSRRSRPEAVTFPGTTTDANDREPSSPEVLAATMTKAGSCSARESSASSGDRG